MHTSVSLDREGLSFLPSLWVEHTNFVIVVIDLHVDTFFGLFLFILILIFKLKYSWYILSKLQVYNIVIQFLKVILHL